MTTCTHISTLGSIIKAKQPERTMLEQHTQEFLNQGGKITMVGTTTSAAGRSSMYSPSDAYNKRTAELSKKA